MTGFDLVLTSILIIAAGSMALRYWLDRGARYMPQRLRNWFLTKVV